MITAIALFTAFILFLIGLAGTVLPVLPGAPVIWLGMIAYSLIAGFEQFDPWFFIGQAVLALAVMGIDYLFTALGSRYLGGTRAAFWGAAIGLLIGLFFIPAGHLLGPFIGATVFDLLARRHTGRALKSGFGATLGIVGALPIKLLLEVVMITWFIFRII
ncbi:MAG TPA: DUF456 domain-containing protein [Firmicutes bacterium]|nr:DUF456 domain-containing protein [Bacillota bacterium]